MELQISKEQKESLEKQQYRFVGHHSAVKVCGWTKNHIMNKGVCYKYAFYGIRSHQCLQMTTSMFCASRCVFCWRGEKAPVSKEWYGPVDDPSFIIDDSIKAHLSLLEGFNGNPKANKDLVSEMKTIRHVALSLTGEPITYPKINEILKEFHKRGISTFLVSNAQYPDEIESIENVTQLYLSIDAPNMDKFKEVDRPLFTDYEDRILRSLDVLATRPYRTCVRLTLIKDLNMSDLGGYKNLIERGNPDMIELKAYMHVGASKVLLEYSQMPFMDDVVDFAEKLESELSGYEIVAKHNPSRVVLLMKKSLNKKSFINFNNFFNIVNSGKQIKTEDYSELEMQDNKMIK